MSSFQIRQKSELPFPAEVVWELITTLDGINAELRPLMTMTIPPHWPDTPLSQITPPVHLGKSWIFAAGMIPVDYDDLRIVELGNRQFTEDSTMASASRWIHERIVTELSPTRCTVQDIVTVTPRRLITLIPFGMRIHSWIINAVFTHRHRRLRHIYR